MQHGDRRRRVPSASAPQEAGSSALVGVQSNQFPRALDHRPAVPPAGMAVAVGGFHVSGCMAMLPEMPPELEEAQALGITLFAGEAEGRMADLLRDIDAGPRQAGLQFSRTICPTWTPPHSRCCRARS